MRFAVGSISLVMFVIALFGCAPTTRTATTVAPTVPSTISASGPTVAVNRVELVSSSPVEKMSPVANASATADAEVLAKLWQTRAREDALADYPLGPGDVLEVSVPNLDEIQTFSTRVSGEGKVTLPLVGLIQAGGMTESQFRDEIRRRLEAKFMNDPQVNVFVREYRSRQVAVTGAVQKPGLYDLTSGKNTVLDLIGLAGGMNHDAAPRVLLFPSESVVSIKGGMASPGVAAAFGNGPNSQIVPKPEPVVINLQNWAQGGGQVHMTLPVRPGDVIMVPSSGEVLVEGWVEKPGSYKITPGLTLLGSIVAAGGPHFAANTSAVELIRTKKDGSKVSFTADLEKIKRGESQDLPVQEGDIIAMPSSTMKLAPYGMYSLISGMFRVGATVY
jgi:polysaccharide biosynthesis/export protein